MALFSSDQKVAKEMFGSFLAPDLKFDLGAFST
jgi:hypothetical protein